jgi:hypothetical protein|tara:strand:+ start:132 stop:683 length:552 start_codon:yes stop_codon:yes gene_type:complete
MKFGAKYVNYQLDDDQLAIIEKTIDQNDTKSNFDYSSCRSMILQEPKLFQILWDIGNEFNNFVAKGGWKLDVKGLEPIEFLHSFPEDKSFDWMLDCSRVDNFNLIPPDMIRKICMIIFVNDDYSGGEFDIELNGPSHEVRYETFNKTKGSLFLFQSDFWYRIRPVKSGSMKIIRTSFIGPSYK